MAENGRAPSLSPNPVNESLEHTSKRFIIPSGGSSVTIPTPLPSQFVSRRGSDALPRKSNEVLTPPSSKKPRGRPPGSKNKPKPPVIIREESDTFPKPIIVEISDGHDVIESLITLAKDRHADIAVLSGSGFIQEVTLFLPRSHVTPCTMKGSFFMLSLSGTYINEDNGWVPPQFITNPPSLSFSIYLSTDNTGNVFGGRVGGNVIASGAVIVTATLFRKPEFLRVGIVNGIIDRNEEDDPKYVGGGSLAPLPTDMNGMQTM